MRKIVVIGAGAAGMAAATRARRVDPEAVITVLEASSEFSRATCSLPYYVAEEIVDRRALTGSSEQKLLAQKIDLRLRCPVSKIDHRERKIHLTPHGELPYDRLIVATGSRLRKVPVVSSTAPNPRLWQLRSIADADHIKSHLNALRPSSVAIVGGGYLGLEMAEVLTSRGCQVTIFHRQSTFMRLAEPGHLAVRHELRRNGVRSQLGCQVTLMDPDCRQRTVEYRDPDGEPRSEGFDAIMLAPGIEPQVSLLEQAGARLGEHGGVKVDSRGETSLAGIYAAGDSVELPSSRGGASSYVPLATSAARLGRVCGENAAGGSLRMSASQACLAIRLFSLQVASAGHPSDWSQAESLSIEFGSAHSPFQTRRSGSAVFFSQAHRGGRLVGAQFVAPEAAALANLAALAMERELSIEELGEMDFCYTPPLSPLWHPFYLASREVLKSRRTAVAR